MFEFEFPGTFADLKQMNEELVAHMGFDAPTDKTYSEWQQHFGLASNEEMTAEHETAMYEQFGSAFITEFPEMTSPFWNMSRFEDGIRARGNGCDLEAVWKQCGSAGTPLHRRGTNARYIPYNYQWQIHSETATQTVYKRTCWS